MVRNEEEIRRMFLDGIPSKKIAEQLGIRCQTLYARMRKLGLSPGKNREHGGPGKTEIPPKEEREEREARILDARAAGITLAEIALQEFGSKDKVGSVSRILRKNGAVSAGYHDKADRDKKVLQMRQDGVSVKEIASCFDMTISNAYRILKNEVES